MINTKPIDGAKLRAAIWARGLTMTRICTETHYNATYLGQCIRRGRISPEMADILASYGIDYTEYAPEEESIDDLR